MFWAKDRRRTKTNTQIFPNQGDSSHRGHEGAQACFLLEVEIAAGDLLRLLIRVPQTLPTKNSIQLYKGSAQII